MVDKIKYFKHMVDGFWSLSVFCRWNYVVLILWWIIFVSIVVNGR